MHLLGTVQTESNGETLVREEAAPVLIEEGSVGLNAVDDAPIWGVMLSLQRHNPAKVVQAQNGRLPAVPRKPDHCFRGSVDMLDDIVLQGFVGHLKRLALWIEVFLLQVVAVVAIQVAEGANWFNENLEFTGRFDHFLILGVLFG